MCVCRLLPAKAFDMFMRLTQHSALPSSTHIYFESEAEDDDVDMDPTPGNTHIHFDSDLDSELLSGG